MSGEPGLGETGRQESRSFGEIDASVREILESHQINTFAPTSKEGNDYQWQGNSGKQYKSRIRVSTQGRLQANFSAGDESWEVSSDKQSAYFNSLTYMRRGKNGFEEMGTYNQGEIIRQMRINNPALKEVDVFGKFEPLLTDLKPKSA